MAAITDRMPPVAVEYDAPGGRAAKRFDDPYEARRFYVHLLKAGRRPAVKNPNPKENDMATTTKKTRRSKPAAAKPAGKQARVTVLGHSAMGVLRWMGAHGWDTAAATMAIAALGEGGKLKPSSITTGLSDGRSGKWGAPAPVTAAEAKQLKQAAKGSKPAADKAADGKAAGTKRARVRACLSKQPKRMRQLLAEAGIPAADTHYNFLNGLVKAGEAVKTADGYRLP